VWCRLDACMLHPLTITISFPGACMGAKACRQPMPGWDLSAGGLCAQVSLCSGTGGITIRVSDQGGGIPQHHLPDVFSYGWTTIPHSSQ
jgi:signal transduction histidine kinase